MARNDARHSPYADIQQIRTTFTHTGVDAYGEACPVLSSSSRAPYTPTHPSFEVLSGKQGVEVLHLGAGFAQLELGSALPYLPFLSYTLRTSGLPHDLGTGMKYSAQRKGQHTKGRIF